MALFVGLDVSLKTTSICIVEGDGKLVWEGKAASEPVPLVKALAPWRKQLKLIGIEFLQRLALDARNNPSYDPARQAHFDHGD